MIRNVATIVFAIGLLGALGCAPVGEAGPTATTASPATTAPAAATVSPSDPVASPGTPAAAPADPAAAKGKKCRKELGCPEAVEVPKCLGTPPPVSFEKVTIAELNKNRAKYKGKFLEVTGPLASTGPESCTEMGCPSDYPCCNACNGALVIGTPDPHYKTAVLLRKDGGEDVFAPDEYKCTGDETLVCCKYVPGGEVVAYGTLKTTAHDPNPYVLTGAAICRR